MYNFENVSFLPILLSSFTRRSLTASQTAPSLPPRRAVVTIQICVSDDSSLLKRENWEALTRMKSDFMEEEEKGPCRPSEGLVLHSASYTAHSAAAIKLYAYSRARGVIRIKGKEQKRRKWHVFKTLHLPTGASDIKDQGVKWKPKTSQFQPALICCHDILSSYWKMRFSKS